MILNHVCVTVSNNSNMMECLVTMDHVHMTDKGKLRSHNFASHKADRFSVSQR